MILDAEAPDFGNAFANVWKRIDVKVVHNIPRIVIDPYIWIVHITNDLCTRFTRTGRATVLFHHEHNVMVSRDWTDLL